MSEWSSGNIYNSFNSNKGLLYQEWYKAIADKKFLPPVEASIDMVQHCNLSCDFCNAGRYLKDDARYIKYMDSDHIVKLLHFLKEWGVRACCYGGGGESTLHKKLPDAIRLTKELGMNSAISTNGTVLNADLLDAFIRNRFIGVSVDAGSRLIYEKDKGKDLFDKVVSNMHILVKEIKDKKSSCEISYKFLITDTNQYDIYNACIIAKGVGVRDFYARPASYNHQGIKDKNRRVYKYDLEAIQEQFNKCRELETEEFRVFTVVHKFDSNFVPDKNFSQCYAAPICIQICPDGNVYFCPDTRDLEYYKLGSHYPDPKEILKFWGGDKHMELTFETGKSPCVSRCTFGPYNRQAEFLFIRKDDPMAWEFV